MLVYDTLLNRPQTAAPSRDGAEDAGRRGPTLRGVLAALRKRAIPIAGCAFAGAILAFGVGKVLTPRYAAEAQIYIDPRDLRLVEKELTPVGQDSVSYLTIVESQAQVITSSNVLGRVVESLGLVHDPEFVPPADSGLLAWLGLSKPAQEAGNETAAAIDALSKHVAVRRTGRTFIVDVEATSREPEKAARIANAVVDSYLAEEAATRAEAASRASAGLSARLEELREDVNRAESKVQAYKAENGLVGTRDTLVTDQQLTQLNAQLAAARVRAADAQSRYDQVQRLPKSGLDAGATEDALASQAIISLRTQYAELSRKQTELTHDLGPRHPLVTSINSQVQQSRRLIDQEIGRTVQAAKTDLARAQATVTALEQSFDKAKGRTVGLAQASIRLRELERDAEASRAVYEAFLVRARETGQQARLDFGNARIITQAVKPVHRSYPPPARVLALLGLAAGLALGLAFAFAEEWLRRDLRAAAPTSRSRFETIDVTRRRGGGTDHGGDADAIGSHPVTVIAGGLR